MHVVAVLALDQVVAFDLAAPCQIFAGARLPDGRVPYEVRVCAVPGARTTARGADCFRLETPWGLESLVQAHTIVIPGHANCLEPPPAETVDLLREAAARGTRIASICTGAFILAATGLLDGMRATTHWHYAGELQRRHPTIVVDASVLYVDNGALLTSAGIAAGLDLCLHLVRRDHGATVAGDTARYTVTPPQRHGGQAQYIKHPSPEEREGRLQSTLAWLHRNLDAPLTLRDIAEHAGYSTRSLNRQFQEQVGTSPLQWLLRARVERAQELLETTGLPVEVIAERVGFASGAVLRRHFTRHAGTTPQTYRHTFRGVHEAGR
ncbi:GlxA family transcriptional regulator [Nonomuraea jiangxiensis]|uniref:Transcriptional regulator GlxA family, contains an amidase domain and an AraC-type DNA-binding HTH domain n=1 Tax=Nonomuraea jiangxiensis TaxID=633440 RepID=A0A1G8QAA0_9ACTN|nr:helix-turn-helix domain-containing protein [Nonomuraea jiangxiensis]SDJ01637.1 Transcriptional regulator GlxA family, contains an amidase domain and an AraC-type DNA-binding HTH domain [Nonomuraea jiangxiensis]